MNPGSKNLVLRFLNAAIWVPVIFCTIFVSKDRQHLLGRLLLIFFSAISGYEMSTLVRRRDRDFCFLESLIFVVLGCFIPILTVIYQEFPQTVFILVLLGVCFVLLMFSWEVFFYTKLRSSNVILRLGSRFLCLVYPGVFLSYLILLTTLNHSIVILTMFFSLTLLNDSFAYFIGILFGKVSKTRGFVRVSPKKSLVGFFGGISASVCVVIVYFYWVSPYLFCHRGVWYAVTMGIVCGLASIVGDLFESLLKRNVGVKDSGSFFMGRGGVLDSFDSLMFTSPVFFYFVTFAN